MSWTRRSFLTTGSTAFAGAMLAGRVARAATPRDIAHARSVYGNRLPPGAPDLKGLAARALEVARGAGATYADVQFRVRHAEDWHFSALDWNPKTFWNPDVGLSAGIGVRVLYNGYWGFAGHNGEATPDRLAALGQAAVAQAKMAATGKPRETTLAPRPVVPDGRWETPAGVDPFTVSDAEKIDFMVAVRDEIHTQRYESLVSEELNIGFMREERTLATMDGSFISQIQRIVTGRYGVRVRRHLVTNNGGRRADPFIGPMGGGWERLLRYPFRERVAAIRDEALRVRVFESMDPGRHDVVFDAASIAEMVKGTLVSATEADRAMGYLANGLGTSFLSDPLDMLDTYQIGSPLVTVSTNRSLAGGCATVGWDDEGVVPGEAVLVKNGMLNDMQTTRESAEWFAPHYTKKGMPVRSNGCAGSGHAVTPPSQVSPNFVVAPGKTDASFLDLVRNLKQGMAVVSGTVRGDYQGLTGLGTPTICYEIKDGALGTVLSGGSWNFRAPEFWKNVVAAGGAASAYPFGFASTREDGDLPNYYTISAVPMIVRNVAFVTQQFGA